HPSFEKDMLQKPGHRRILLYCFLTPPSRFNGELKEPPVFRKRHTAEAQSQADTPLLLPYPSISVQLGSDRASRLLRKTYCRSPVTGGFRSGSIPYGNIRQIFLILRA